ncbi:hypothetical protein DRE_03804 [Drechslerella stenobrocha 248]|uniref:SCA7 domain-containing protein n=1 Tax=Drechslerella stenobrocha 248 TaxID=1043628 RepID=W7I3S4_9PEZI|nr:hypothetical protein DRE_03804 [Drechslerella stenobrocha 248]
MTESKQTLVAAQKARKRAIALICNPAADSFFTNEDRIHKKLRLASPLGSSTDKPLPEKKNEVTYALMVNPRLSEQEAANFPFGRPLLDEAEIIQCKHCKKPILRPNAQSHIKACLKVKAEAKKERKLAKEAASGKVDPKKVKDGKGDAKEDGDEKDADKGKASDKPAKAAAATKTSDTKAVKTAAKTTAKTKAGGGTKKKADGEEEKADGKNSKKRKATDDDKGKDKEGPKTKKTKKEKPAPKPKGPVDVERQCGVLLPNGQLCARSLTCKSHSMGAKRAVQGRPAPYDTLLAAYQKKNQAKQQKAAINASNPAPDDLEANSLHVDSDEEMEFVMAAVARSNPQPIVPTILLSTRQKYQHRRFALMLGAALKPPNPPLSAVDARPFGNFGFMG